MVRNPLAVSRTGRSKAFKQGIGQAGFDNPRENIDPHIKTKAISTKEINKCVNYRFIYTGDSITDEDNLRGTKQWPEVLQTDYPWWATGETFNLAVGGQSANQINNNYASTVSQYAPARDRDDYYFFCLAGTNDLGGGSSVADTYTRLKSIWSQARTDGFKVVAMCLTKVDEGTFPGRNALIDELNVLIASNPALYDYLIRTDIALPDGADTTYFETDGIHPNTAGEERIAYYVNYTMLNQVMHNAEPAFSILSGSFGVGISNPVADIETSGEISGATLRFSVLSGALISGNMYPHRYNQATEPSGAQLSTNELCFWRDSSSGKIYIMYEDIYSGVKKVELT